MNNNLKPIDQLLDNWKANIIEQVSALYKQYKEKRGAIWHGSRARQLWQA